MAARCAATAVAGKLSAYLPGCRTTADWSRDGNTTSRISSALYNLPAFSCCSGIYEMGSSVHGHNPIEVYCPLVWVRYAVGIIGVRVWMWITLAPIFKAQSIPGHISSSEL